MISPDRSWKLGLFIIIGFWVLVSFGDYPPPFLDDLPYIGAAMNLAQHGVYSNSYCEMQATIGVDRPFFNYMPIENYVLAGWLKLFGISTLSFHVLFTLLALLVSFLIYRFFAPVGYIWLAALLICLAVFGLLGGTGLRADALGICFLLVGFDAWRTKNALGFFWKNLFLGLVVITFPNVAILAMLLSLAGLHHQKLFHQRTARKLAPFALAMGAAYAACFVLLMVCIKGRLPEFLYCIIQNQQASALGVRERFQFFTPLGMAKWGVVQFSFLVLVSVLIYRWRKNPLRREAVFFLGLSVLAFITLGYSSANSATGAHIWAFGCLMAGLFIIIHEKWNFRAWGIYIIIFAIAAFGHAHVAIQHILANRPPSQEKRDTLLAEIARLHPHRLYVDAYALRELYDYRLPPDALAFEARNIPVGSDPNTAESLPKNSVCIVSVNTAFPTRLSPDAVKDRKPLKIFGHPVPDVIQNPYDLVIMDNRD